MISKVTNKSINSKQYDVRIAESDQIVKYQIFLSLLKHAVQPWLMCLTSLHLNLRIWNNSILVSYLSLLISKILIKAIKQHWIILRLKMLYVFNVENELVHMAFKFCLAFVEQSQSVSHSVSVFIARWKIMNNTGKYLFNFKGYNCALISDMNRLENAENFELRDDDVFVITYPRSGKFN